MEIVIFAEQFRNGRWDAWKHACSPAEIEAVVNTAIVKARVRASNGQPIHSDFLEGARCIFNVARGLADHPNDGDTQVYCICVDKIVIGVYEKICKYSQKVAEARELVQVAPKGHLDRENSAVSTAFV